MNGRLELERFRALVEAYGGRFELWPEDERELGRALLLESAEARALVRAEADLDARLAAELAPEPSPELWRRLNEIPARVPQRRPFWRLRGFWIPAVGWALAAAIGFGWGLEAAPLDASLLGADSEAVTSDTTAGDSPALDTDDLGALARGAVPELEE